MNKFLSLALALLVGFVSPAFAGNPRAPIQEARDALEHAHSLLTKKEEGGGGKKKVGIPAIMTALDNAETHLAEAKNNKGTHKTDVLK
jgi:hypothetical protein